MPQTVSGSADHRHILATAKEWAGARLALATVVETWRSAPAPLGTHMLIHEDGRFVGSVSGGCVEGDVLATAEAVLGGAPAVVRRYGLSDDAVWQAGLPCGGEIAVLVQPAAEDGFPTALFERIATANRAGKSVTVATDLETGVSMEDGANGFLNRYLPPRRLIIVGAVEIARHLARLAQDCGFDVTLVDPRGRFLTAERFPGVVLDDRWPDEAVAALCPDSRTAVVTLSHDPKIDDPALVAALTTPAGYVAALGSQRAQRARRERLSVLGLDHSAIARVEGPAGVAINAISAPEIALSIAAGMVRAFNHGLR